MERDMQRVFEESYSLLNIAQTTILAACLH
jgi:hypothetical protein